MEAAPDASRVEAHIELTPADVLHGLQSMPERRLGAVMVYVMAAMVLGFVVIFKGGDLFVVLPLAFGLVVFVILNILGTRRLARHSFEEMLRDKREITYVFTPSAVEITTQHSHVHNDYEAIKRYVVTRHTLLLYIAGRIAQIVPLRAFDAADRERVLGWLKVKVKPAPRVPVAFGRMLILWAVLVLAFLLIWQFLNP